jgi:hypothetical protein
VRKPELSEQIHAWKGGYDYDSSKCSNQRF